MNDYFYSLIRYIPNPARMEPINVGVVVNGGGQTRVKFYGYAALRGDIDTSLFKQWRELFAAELKSKSGLTPPQGDPLFLDHLASLASGQLNMSRRLAASFDEKLSIDQVTEQLFSRLVLPLEDDVPATEKRPTKRFRQLEEEYHLLQRGVKRHEPVPIHASARPLAHWRPYRTVLNGSYTVIDKIEVRTAIGQTADELNALVTSVTLLDDFLKTTVNGKGTTYVLLVDPILQPFKNQSAQDFQSMKDDIERLIDEVAKHSRGQVLRTADESQRLADKLNKDLPPLSLN